MTKIIWVVLTIAVALSYGLDVPETVDQDGTVWIGPIRKCTPGTDEELNQCMDIIIQDLTKKAANGIDEIGLRPLDPYKMSRFNYAQNLGESVAIKIAARNVHISGLTKFDKLQFKVDTANKKMYFNYEVPNVNIKASYNLGGNAFFVKLEGSGPFNGDISNVKVRGHMDLAKVVRDDGKTIVQASTIIIDEMTIKRMNVKITGLFPGMPLISPVVHYFANRHGSEIFQIMAPEMTKTIGRILTKDVLNPVIANLPYLVDYL